MANVSKNVVLRAKIEGVLTELLVKSNAANIYVDDTTTLATKLAEIIAALNEKAVASEVETALAGKAAASHTHEQSEVNGLVDALAGKASTTALTEAINALRQEMLGDVPVEAYNTFTELAQYIETHQEAADALTEAIGKKADQTTVDGIVETLNGLGSLATKSVVTESDLDSALAEKVNAASEGNHAHLNKDLLDTYTQTEANLADAVAKKHEHANKTVLDGITSAKVTAWDAAEKNAKDYADGLNNTMSGRVDTLEGKAHEHANKTVLDGVTAEKVAAWDAAEKNAKDYADGLNTAMDGRMQAVEGKAHEHANKTVIDGITAENVAAWNAKGNIYYSAEEPANLTENDLWFAIVE